VRGRGPIVSPVPDRIGRRPLALDGPVSRRFRAAGIRDFAGAAEHLLRLPYGRISDRSRFWLVLEEGRGACTIKHAALAQLAAEQAIDVQLMLGIYEMSKANTPGVGRVLSRYGLTHIPEAHCYLRAGSERIDITGIAPGARPIERFLHEEPIAIDQIGAYKIDLHRRFLREWIARSDALRGRTLDELWQIREECIGALSQAPVGAA